MWTEITQAKTRVTRAEAVIRRACARVQRLVVISCNKLMSVSRSRPVLHQTSLPGSVLAPLGKSVSVCHCEAPLIADLDINLSDQVISAQ